MASLKIALVTLPALALAAGLDASHERIVAMPMHQYAQDCGKRSNLRVIPGAAAMLQTTKSVPGAGIDEFTPFETVLKDGFLETDCIKDYMYYRGDKFGDNKYDYKLGPVSNVSIVHYDAFVLKEDRKPMTQKVCFEFCRTVPHMGFFGIVNGRNCYCAPYFTAMASDSSQCDAVCEGEKTLMCGGTSKSSIFTMHMCASTEEDLSERAGVASSLESAMGAKAKVATGYSDALQTAGKYIQDTFGNVGDSGAANQGHAAMDFAGEVEHKAEEASKIADALGDLVKKSQALKDFTEPETVTKAERIMEGIDETMAEGEGVEEELDELSDLAKPERKSQEGAAKQYYPVMYFVDKKYVDVPQTCAGDMVAKPMIGDADACATACDAHIHECVGFQFYSGPAGGGCILLKNFKTGFYYTGCKSKKPTKGGGAFLQGGKAGQEVMCYAKLSKYESTTLAVDPAGKCKQCFNELTKADRCFA
jgi:uncharacterized protein YukE